MKRRIGPSQNFSQVVGRRADKEPSRPFWLEFLLPAWLLRLPASVPVGERKIYMARLAVPAIGLVAHLLLLILFLTFGVASMAWFNVASVAIFTLAAAVVRSGRHHLGIAIAVIEVGLHIPIATYLLGLNAGYLIYNFLVAMTASLVYRREVRERRLIIVYAFASSALAAAVTYGRPPAIALVPWQLHTIFAVVATSTYLGLVLFCRYFVNLTDQAEKRVEEELQRSEQLLLNVLPAEVAERLKAKPNIIADRYGSVTVMFADIVGFTELSSHAASEDVVVMLNEVFSAFDRIAEKYALEKIKTIGDAYMLVGGLPRPMRDHAARVVDMALDMTAAIKAFCLRTQTPLEIRIGIHSGPVVAGVIGEKKFAYDLWGDTVNVASRLESQSLPGRIQISNDTRILLGDEFDLEARGRIEIKGKGSLETWFVKERKGLATITKETLITPIQRAS